MVNAHLRSDDIFINCPFDDGYKPLFDAIVFTAYHLGFIARCSLEEDDGGEFRLTKIERMIQQCRFGINDLSAVSLDPRTNLPRFNMPLELGMFLGCKRFGPVNQGKKRMLILDSHPFRYRECISDISGQDIRCHGGEPERAIREVRDWLQGTSRRNGLAGGGEIVNHYRQFRSELPRICSGLHLEPERLTFLDLSTVIAEWLRTSR